MPGTDDFHRKVKPQANESLGLSDPARQSATGAAEPGATASRTARRGRPLSAQVVRLAERLSREPEALANQIPEDTVRRTKYPVIESVTEDGKRIFRHDPLVQEGPRSEVRP